MELRYNAFGDEPSKFIRLGLRNAHLEAPLHSLSRHPSTAPLPVDSYSDAEARERAKSSWPPFPRLCETLAALQPLQHPRFPLYYEQEIEAFAAAWYVAGWPVPAGYLDSAAQPPSKELQVYQQQRGPGDGRSISAVVPASMQDMPDWELVDFECPHLSSPAASPPSSRPTSPVPAFRGRGALPADTDPALPSPPSLDVRTASGAAVLLVLISVLA